LRDRFLDDLPDVFRELAHAFARKFRAVLENASDRPGPPYLGEHNDEVLRELGFSADQIEAFRASATIPPSNQSVEVVGGKR
jgi:crotonobetainyl-CoA:carnitine CoA-transferase CaiB-like acyl-CoA transferase